MDILVPAQLDGNNAMTETSVYKQVKQFSEGIESVTGVRQNIVGAKFIKYCKWSVNYA